MRASTCEICGKPGKTNAPAGEPVACPSCWLFWGFGEAIGRAVVARENWTRVCDMPGAELRTGSR
jgi:hypothetical protein